MLTRYDFVVTKTRKSIWLFALTFYILDCITSLEPWSIILFNKSNNRGRHYKHKGFLYTGEISSSPHDIQRVKTKSVRGEVHSVLLCQDSRHLFVCIPEADDLIRFDNLSHSFVCINIGEDPTRLENLFYPFVCISVADNVTRLDTLFRTFVSITVAEDLQMF